MLSLESSEHDYTLRIGFILLCLLLLPFAAITISTKRFETALSKDGRDKTLPTVPYAFPLLFHAIPMGWSPVDFIMSTVETYGWQNPLQMCVGWLRLTIVCNPTHIQQVFKSSKQLSSTPGVIYAMKHLLRAPASVIPWYIADDSGMAATPSKGSTVDHSNRIHFHQARLAQKFLSSQHLAFLQHKFAEVLERNLRDDIGETGEWVEHPDLYAFLQNHGARASIESLMGTKIFELNPDLIEDFWKFDSHVPWFLRRVPRLFMLGAYSARDRLHEGVKRWHAYAHTHSDCTRIEPDDPEWEPFFGSKLIRARQDNYLQMKFMNADARASEDLGLLMAANGNAIPSIFWYVYEALRDNNLQERMKSEVASCTGSEGVVNHTKLITMPWMQSSYAEVLRLRVAIAMTRVNHSEPMNLGGFHIPRGQPLLLFSRPPALNEEAWTLAGRPPAEAGGALEKFHAERFLVPKNREEKSQEKELSGSDDAEVEFSMNGLAGLWLPYGGGQRMCPGRHFAKAELISAFAILFSQYDIELSGPPGLDKMEADLRWFPAGALPPVGKVPFRLRRKRLNR